MSAWPVVTRADDNLDLVDKTCLKSSATNTKEAKSKVNSIEFLYLPATATHKSRLSKFCYRPYEISGGLLTSHLSSAQLALRPVVRQDERN